MKISKLNLTDLSNENAIQASVQGNDTIQDAEFLRFGEQPEEEGAEFTKSQLDIKIEEAYQKGVQEGKQLGVQETTQNVLTVEQSTDQGIKSILTSLTSALSQFEEQKNIYKKDMSQLTYHVIKKILGEKVKEGFDEIILNGFEKILPLVSRETKIIIKLHPDTTEKVKAKMEKIITEMKFTGDLEFVPDSTMAAENCKVEWGSNGINFDLDEKIKEIDEIINEYIKSI